MAQDGLVALGGNMPSDAGSPEDTLRAAVDAMRAHGLRIGAISHFYATPCFPEGAGPDYVNAAARVKGVQNPYKLLEKLHEIEDDFGRQRQRRWGMRTLDLDLVAVGDMVLPDRQTQTAWRNLDPAEQQREAPGELILPHPRLQDRAFVLVPLADVAAAWVDPVSGRNVMQMRDALPAEALEGVVPLY